MKVYFSHIVFMTNVFNSQLQNFVYFEKCGKIWCPKTFWKWRNNLQYYRWFL